MLTNFVNFNTFPRSGTWTLEEVLRNAFSNIGVQFQSHQIHALKKKNLVISLRNPSDCIKSIISYNLLNLTWPMPPTETNELCKSELIKYNTSKNQKLHFYNFYYYSFMKEVWQNKENIYIILFEDLINDPNPDLKKISKKFNLKEPKHVDIKKIEKIISLDKIGPSMNHSGSTHLPGYVPDEIKKAVSDIVDKKLNLKKSFDLYQNLVDFKKNNK